MQLSKFVSAVTKAEGKKSSVSVGNMREVLKIVNKKLKGKLYKLIKEQ